MLVIAELGGPTLVTLSLDGERGGPTLSTPFCGVCDSAVEGRNLSSNFCGGDNAVFGGALVGGGGSFGA